MLTYRKQLCPSSSAHPTIHFGVSHFPNTLNKLGLPCSKWVDLKHVKKLTSLILFLFSKNFFVGEIRPSSKHNPHVLLLRI